LLLGFQFGLQGSEVGPGDQGLVDFRCEPLRWRKGELRLDQIIVCSFRPAQRRKECRPYRLLIVARLGDCQFRAPQAYFSQIGVELRTQPGLEEFLCFALDPLPLAERLLPDWITR
jgi:hypothetical protein